MAHKTPDEMAKEHAEKGMCLLSRDIFVANLYWQKAIQQAAEEKKAEEALKKPEEAPKQPEDPKPEAEKGICLSLHEFFFCADCFISPAAKRLADAQAAQQAAEEKAAAVKAVEEKKAAEEAAAKKAADALAAKKAAGKAVVKRAPEEKKKPNEQKKRKIEGKCL